jgi:tRNA-dihydrouridine synthase
MILLIDVSSVMVARGAQWNPSVFRKEGKLAFQEAATAYLKKVSISSLPCPHQTIS